MAAKFDPGVHHRRSMRLAGYDYSQAGVYFVTICTRNRECMLGDVVEGNMQLNKIGETALRIWSGLPSRFPFIELDRFVAMPNHIHGVIILHNVGAGLALPKKGDATSGKGAASSAPTLGDIMRVFKSISAIIINRLLDRQGQPVWQRNYYEHIVRDEESPNRIREYIETNPLRWTIDCENPGRKGDDEFDVWLAGL